MDIRFTVIAGTIVLLGMLVAIIILLEKSRKAFQKGIEWADAQRKDVYTDHEFKQVLLNYYAMRHAMTPIKYLELSADTKKLIDDWFDRNVRK